MTTNKELQGRLEELADVVEKLITHVEVLAVEVRKGGSVPQADLDETLNGISDLRSRSAEHIRADGDEDERKKKQKRAKPAR